LLVHDFLRNATNVDTGTKDTSLDLPPRTIQLSAGWAFKKHFAIKFYKKEECRNKNHNLVIDLFRVTQDV
jgi:hypothetical protein